MSFAAMNTEKVSNGPFEVTFAEKTSGASIVVVVTITAKWLAHGTEFLIGECKKLSHWTASDKCRI